MSDNGETVTIPEALAPYKRHAWKPITTAGDGTPTSSKFSGTPLLMPGEEWPICPQCNIPMQLFLQLNMAQIPEEARQQFGSGILQFFKCDDGVDHQAVSDEIVLRLLSTDQPFHKVPNIVNPIKDAFPPKTIIGWEPFEEYPDWDELEEFGIELNDDQWNILGKDIRAQEDKLAGWPYWMQSISYPDCPICGQTMRLLFQSDSQGNLPCNFGDVGIGHITQCKEHKDQLAFGWDCA